MLLVETKSTSDISLKTDVFFCAKRKMLFCAKRKKNGRGRLSGGFTLGIKQEIANKHELIVKRTNLTNALVEDIFYTSVLQTKHHAG